MKHRFLFISLLLMLRPLTAQENLAVGDDLWGYLEKNHPRYKLEGVQILPFEEGRIEYRLFSRDNWENEPVILMAAGKYPIGVMQKTRDGFVCLLDLTGDGVLDEAFPEVILPFWVLVISTPDTLKNADARPFGRILDSFYRSFGGDADPYTSGAHQANLKSLIESLSDDGPENRDLYYALYCYYFLGIRWPQYARQVIEILAGSCQERFGGVHPLLILHRLETCINLEDFTRARQFVRDLLEFDPGFVPALVYRWQLEEDAEKRTEYYRDLKENHPRHWIVKKL